MLAIINILPPMGYGTHQKRNLTAAIMICIRYSTCLLKYPIFREMKWFFTSIFRNSSIMDFCYSLIYSEGEMQHFSVEIFWSRKQILFLLSIPGFRQYHILNCCAIPFLKHVKTINKGLANAYFQRNSNQFSPTLDYRSVVIVRLNRASNMITCDDLFRPLLRYPIMGDWRLDDAISVVISTN